MSFVCQNSGDCCGPVAVTMHELKKIQKSIRKYPAKYNRIKNQLRESLTCMFRDTENHRCSIYHIRPEICKMFGHYEGMICPRNAEYGTGSREEGAKRLKGEYTGVLTLQITWENIMEVK